MCTDEQRARHEASDETSETGHRTARLLEKDPCTHGVASCVLVNDAWYEVPDAGLHVSANDPRVLALADQLFCRSEGGRCDLALAIRVDPVRVGSFRERDIAWDLSPLRFVVSIGTCLSAVIDLPTRSVDAHVGADALGADPALVARTLLEAPVAVLLARGRYTVLHAGAAVGPRGAVVLRGSSGAGKSTLTAALWRAGFRVLGDETILVHRTDPDLLVSSVRDLTVLPDSARLLGIEARTSAAFVGGEDKRRVDLFSASHPDQRVARRRATVLLGPRVPGPARLVPIHGAEFRAEFRLGEVAEERKLSDPDEPAAHWDGHETYRLLGAEDLEGAVTLITDLVGRPS